MLAGIRSLFKSSRSERLTGLSLAIVGLVLAGLISIVGTPLIRNYQRSRDAVDWFSTDKPTLLTADKTSGPFLNQLRELVGQLRTSKIDPNLKSDFLVRLDPKTKPEDDATCQRLTSYLFENIEVYPACVTFSKKSGDLSPAEKAVFYKFSEFAKKLAARLSSSRSGSFATEHFERVLADALDVSSLSQEQNLFTSPWLYVASAAGALAVFPGAAVIGYERWDITGRPWFMAAFGGDTKLANTINGGDWLTATYLDVLGQRALHVRTYLQKFTLNGEDFAVGVDLYRAMEIPVGLMASARSPNLRADSLYPSLLIGTILLFAIICRFTVTTKVDVELIGADLISGSVEITDSVGRKDVRGAANSVSLKVEKAPISATRTNSQESLTTEETEVKKVHSARAIQNWEVKKITSFSWRLFREFESVWTKPVGVIRVEYTNGVRPNATWAPPLKFNFVGEQERTAFEKNLPEFLSARVDAIDTRLALRYSELINNNALNKIDVPACVRSLLTPDDAVAIQHKRAYVTLRRDQLSELYRNAEVRAVVLSGYLEALLEKSDPSFLTLGRTINRLISFKSSNEDLQLSAVGRKNLVTLIDDYNKVSARLLRRVDVPINDDEEDLRPVYDFAILTFTDPKAVVVVVSHTVSQATRIDSAGRTLPPEFVVEGYISWREADIDFYQALFATLARDKSTSALRLPSEHHASHGAKGA